MLVLSNCLLLLVQGEPSKESYEWRGDLILLFIFLLRTADKVMLHSATTEAKVKADKQRKFELYYDFTRNTNALQSHQVLYNPDINANTRIVWLMIEIS